MTPTLKVIWPLRKSGNHTLPAPPQLICAVGKSVAPDAAPLVHFRGSYMP